MTSVRAQYIKEVFKDYVKVVRCKDCKYCEACDDEETAEPLIFDGLIWCELHEFSRKPDYYCGDAERKEGDGDGQDDDKS